MWSYIKNIHILEFDGRGGIRTHEPPRCERGFMPFYQCHNRARPPAQLLIVLVVRFFSEIFMITCLEAMNLWF